MNSPQFLHRGRPGADGAAFLGSHRSQPAFLALEMPAGSVEDGHCHHPTASGAGDRLAVGVLVLAAVHQALRLLGVLLLVVTETPQDVGLAVLERPEGLTTLRVRS